MHVRRSFARLAVAGLLTLALGAATACSSSGSASGGENCVAGTAAPHPGLRKHRCCPSRGPVQQGRHQPQLQHRQRRGRQPARRRSRQHRLRRTRYRCGPVGGCQGQGLSGHLLPRRGDVAQPRRIHQPAQAQRSSAWAASAATPSGPQRRHHRSVVTEWAARPSRALLRPRRESVDKRCEDRPNRPTPCADGGTETGRDRRVRLPPARGHARHGRRASALRWPAGLGACVPSAVLRSRASNNAGLCQLPQGDGAQVLVAALAAASTRIKQSPNDVAKQVQKAYYSKISQAAITSGLKQLAVTNGGQETSATMWDNVIAFQRARRDHASLDHDRGQR